MDEYLKNNVFAFDPAVQARKELALLPHEQHFLTVVRCFLQTYETPGSQCWMNAFLYAEQRFPPPFGATVAHACHLAIETLCLARGRSLSYLKTDNELADRAVTNSERQLIEVLRAVQTSDVEKAEWTALLLCHGGDTKDFLAALERLFIITGQIEELKFQG